MKNIKEKYNFNKNSFSLLEVIIITLAFSSLTGVIVGYVFYIKNNRNLILDKNLLDIVDTYNQIVNNFYDDIDKNSLEQSAIEGMMNELNEQYSIYMSDEDTLSLKEKLDGTYKGIGIKIIEKDGEVIIDEVYSNTPASKNGLKKNDQIISINGKNIKGMELKEVKGLLLSLSEVKIKYKRKNEEKEVKIKLEQIATPCVEYKVYNKNDKKIGYIYLSTFSKTSESQVKEALKKLKKENIDSLIFDVRNNTGGYLESATDILSLFNKKGKILYHIENNGNKKTIYDVTDEYVDYDMVVLINNMSASASEILASSLKETYGAILIGNKTYGKGLVQQTAPLSTNGMIKFTSAKWYTPNENFIDKVGIEPGIEINQSAKFIKNPISENDTQLQKALEILSN